jgi:uncharacterized MAPEG superfamily protein
MSGKVETDSRGIPLKTIYPEGTNLAMTYTIGVVVFSVISSVVTYFAIVRGNDTVAAKLELLAKYDLGYLYVAILILKIGQVAMGINMGCARNMSKVPPPDQHIYEVKGAEGSKLGYVLMDNEGLNGKFNRAQRAVQNFNESFPQLVLYIIFAGFVYPKEVSMLTTLYMITRLVYALGYSKEANGRFGGLMLSTLVANAIEFLVGFIAYKLFA